jgi:hypothetical protein
MENDRNQILETDVLAPDSAPSEPAAPVVVVQYRNRGVPVWALVLLVFVVTMGTVVFYHRLVVERYGAQAARNQRTLEAIIAEQQPPPPKPVEQTPVGPLALNSQPVPETPRAPAAAPLPAGPRPEKPDPPAKSDGPESAPPVAQARKTGEPAKEAVAKAQDDGSAASGEQAPAKTQRAGRLVETPFRIDEPDPFDAPLPPAIASAQPAPKAKSAAETGAPNGTSAPPSAVRAADAVPAEPKNAAQAPRTPPADLPRLPTLEESMREIEAEAADKGAELKQLNQTKQAEARSVKDRERRKFRDELRDVLRDPPDQAGPEIDRLVSRYGYDVDPLHLRTAFSIWVSRRSQALKVNAIRELGLPETVILNFMSDEMRWRIRRRNGPRNENEARVMAAQQLMKYELPAPGGKDASDSVASPARGAPPAGQPDRLSPRAR